MTPVSDRGPHPSCTECNAAALLSQLTGRAPGADIPANSHQEPIMANKLRHIAISVKDPEKTAKFFEEAFGMTRAGNAQRGIYMTDGIFNVALLNFGDE